MVERGVRKKRDPVEKGQGSISLFNQTLLHATTGRTIAQQNVVVVIGLVLAALPAKNLPCMPTPDKPSDLLEIVS